ncbi:MAG TPA: hypothetical protein VFS21_13790 [Roseiflexaceae bacterium]|nr:hypothetical protein [Roseiflexaceae bacterium]
MPTNSLVPDPQPHFPLIIRALIDLYQAGELPDLASVEIEPEYGMVARLVHRNSSVRLLRSSVTDINGYGTAKIARDKGYTKFFLQRLGYCTPAGKVFLMSGYISTIDRRVRRASMAEYAHVEQIAEYAHRQVGYPCYLKPNDGSQGRGVVRCVDERDVWQTLEQYELGSVTAVLVEQEICMPDYRVVVYGDEVVACYLRRPLAVVGDGVAPLHKLLERRMGEFVARGRDVRLRLEDQRIASRAAHFGYTLDSVLAEGERFQVFDASNLSLGGEAEDVLDSIHPRWLELCCEVGRAMGMRLCGVDLACADLSDPQAPYSILELNASPGLDHYAEIGPAQRARVYLFYQRLFNELLFW